MPSSPSRPPTLYAATANVIGDVEAVSRVHQLIVTLRPTARRKVTYCGPLQHKGVEWVFPHDTPLGIREFLRDANGVVQAVGGEDGVVYAVPQHAGTFHLSIY